MYNVKRFSSEIKGENRKDEKLYSQPNLKQKARDLVDRMRRDYGETLRILGK